MKKSSTLVVLKYIYSLYYLNSYSSKLNYKTNSNLIEINFITVNLVHYLINNIFHEKFKYSYRSNIYHPLYFSIAVSGTKPLETSVKA